MFTKLANPTNFQKISDFIFPKCFVLFFIFLISGFYYVFFSSPPDYLQGETVRIMYIHVPCAWLSLGIYTMMACCSFFSIVFKHTLADIISRACAPLGACFTLATLITGSIWGKPTWGTWWAWDARITSMLILALFYGMYLVSWRIYEDKEKVFKVSTIITILGIINVPIIKYSVDWWNTLHQPASINIFSKSSIHSSMLFPLLIMTAAFALFSLLIFLMKYNTELIKIKNKGLDRL